MPAWALTDCEHCGARLAQSSTGRPRRFCSTACKQAAYRGRVTKVNRTGQDVSGPIIYQAVVVAPALAMAAPARKAGE